MGSVHLQCILHAEEVVYP